MITSKFIVFEGIDGSGKTTMIRKTYDKLTSLGYNVLVTREPGGTDLAERLRELILSNDYVIDTDTERLMFFAARCHHTKNIILPFLNKGSDYVVLCDRYVDSTLAYQSTSIEELERTREWSKQFDWLLTPDCTIYLQIPTSVSKERIKKRYSTPDIIDDEDRIESMLHARILRIYKNFEYLSKDYTIIDGTNSIDKVSQDILEAILPIVNAEKAVKQNL